MLNIEQHSGIQMIANPHTTSGFTPSFLSKRETEPVRHLHMSLDDYAATPLVELSALARRSGVRSILVKDESQRFGLNAFKALGGLFALVRVICKHLGLDYRERQTLYGRINLRVEQMVAAGLLVCTAYLVAGTYNPFLYFNF